MVRFEDGVKLVKIRGESMQAAADAQPSAMVSVIGLSSDKVILTLLCANIIPSLSFAPWAVWHEEMEETCHTHAGSGVV
jgi:malonyl CoA-acyl carrier protein transacylase